LTRLARLDPGAQSTFVLEYTLKVAGATRYFTLAPVPLSVSSIDT